MKAMLEGWCGPVVLDGADPGEPGVCLGLVDEDGDARVADYHDALWRSMGRVSLDLSRAECRDRVARVVSLTVGLVSPVPLWYRSNSSRPPYGEWSLGGSWPTMTSFSGLGGTMGGVIHRVPALADLDPNDPAPLPDGSRRVDALALAAVASHVLGGSDAR